MKVSFILDSIDSGTIVLPEFQRGYVWSRNQVKGLIQSLYQRYPVGGLLIWNTSADATELRGQDGSKVQNVKLLLDGQQRVTSLYGVVRGEPPQFFEDPDKLDVFTGLHFHLDQEVFEFYSPSKMSGDPLWVSVTELMIEGPVDFTQRLGQVEGLDQSRLVTYINRIQHLYGIREIDLHDENLSGPDKTVDVVVDIFNRVNSGGTKLSKGDLALARICALRPAARDELREAITGWKKAGFDFKLDWLLRCVNIVVTGEAKFSALKDVSSEDFGVGLKKSIKAIDFILNLLGTRLGLDHDRVLMGRYGIPIMVKVVVERGGSLSDLQEQNDLLYWYVHQAAWGRFSGSTESLLDRDLQAIEDSWIEGLITEMAKSRGTLQVRAEDFDSQTVGSRFYPILYMLTRVQDAKDFCTGMPLSSSLLGKNSSLEVHHIFPKSLLQKAGYDKRLRNAVANFAFLTAECNRKIGWDDPVEYMAKVDEAHPDVLPSQWIPADTQLRAMDRFEDFLEARRQLLANATNEFLDGLRSGHSADVAGVGGGVAAGEDDESELRGLSDLCASLGLARPEVPGVVVDAETGEALVYADAAWHEGVQVGMSEQVALLLEPDAESEARLGELGYRFFTSEESLRHYLEVLLDRDIDGDGHVGEPEEEATVAPAQTLATSMTPTELAAELGIDPKALRAWLRREFGRQSQDKGSGWDIPLEAVEAARERWGQGRPASDLGRDAKELEAAFHEEMVATYQDAKGEIGYTATRFIQMVADQGGVATARSLLKAGPSDGFAALWEKQRLDLAIEFKVLRPEFRDLFTDQERRQARQRLEDHGLDVDAALAGLAEVRGEQGR